MVWHHTQFDHINVMSFRYFVENVFTKLFIPFAPKHIVSVLGAPLKVVKILPNAMATANQIHDFVLLDRFS